MRELEKLAAKIIVVGLCAFICVYPSMANVSWFNEDAQLLISMKSAMVASNSAFETWSIASNGSPHCSWTGVQCDRRGRVVALDISNMNISGPIPPQIVSLSELRSLNLSNNVFNGGLPPNVSNLRNLESLDVYNNNCSGPLPVELSRLVNLKYLNLGGNYFSGSIPREYAKLTSLEYLSLSGNDLTGAIPPELGFLVNLKSLYLGYYNKFSGGIPPQFGNLSKLVYLDIANCGVEGPIPSELGRLEKLDTLFLQDNALSGPIPPQLGRLGSLKSLDLSLNELTGEIPMEFKELKELKLLNLFINKLHGEIPSFIGDLPNLEVLQLWKNNFRGPVPQQLGQNGRLVEVDVSSNRLTGSIPPNLCNGGKLRILIILNNLFFGPIPETLGTCNSLVRVRMGQNYLNGSIPAGLLYLPRLNMIELHYNYLTGTIPERKGKAPAGASQINLSNNHLGGSLPSSIGLFSALQIFLVNGNRLTGPVPTEIGRLAHITKLDFSRNRFSGSIPAEMGRCKALNYIDLSQNKFSGPMPVQLTGMRNLNYFNVSRNRFNGSIPREFASMQSLSSVDFSYNNFSGLVPTGGQFSYFNVSTFAGNPALCGPFLGSPCSVAASTSPVQAQGNTKGVVSSSLKLVIGLALLFCSLAFAVVAVVKARALRKDRDARSWKMTAFQKLDFGRDEVLESLKEDNVIGKGGAGIVYRGIMSNGEEVAVKKLMRIGSAGSTHDHGFSAEIQTLGRIRHRHIVRLLAFCSNHDSNLLVYEYMPNGSLGELLHGNKGGHLHWQTRYKIALEAAKGLCYLHHDCNPLIVHRDVKSNNILLDSNFEAHVADFGLAKFLQDSGASECMSSIAGSYGYIAPEYAYTLKVDEKSDVYSFGVVLLELITGRKPVGDFGDGVDIVQWMKKTTNSVREGVTKILDARLSSIPLEEAMHLFFVAMLCVEEQSVERPTMREVVQMLADCPKTKPTQYFSPSQKEPKKPVSIQPPNLLTI